MPKLPKAKKRSWIPKREKRYGQTDNSSFYQSKQWRATRKWYIQHNPLCEQCEREGRIASGNCVDHIKPISKGGHNLHESNLQTLCNKCHAKKSAQEGVEYRKGIKIYKREGIYKKNKNNDEGGY
jgi:5-methylcytosine-specific restriction protein A